MARSKVLAILLVVGLLSLLISLAISFASHDAPNTVTIRDSNDANYSQFLSDMGIIKLTDIKALPSDKVYEGWFVNKAEGRVQSTGILQVGADGTVNQTYTSTGDKAGENLFTAFDTFVVSVEPVPDSDPGPSADKPYAHTIPKGGLAHIRHLLSSLGGNPPYKAGFHEGEPKGIAVGLREQTSTALFHARLSVNSPTMAQVLVHACHVVNIIEGAEGENFDASCGNPGDGFGVLNYAQAAELHAGLASSSAPDDPVIVAHHKQVKDSARQVWAWARDARDSALRPKNTSDLDAAKLFIGNAKTTLEKSLNGFDDDGDGTIERITGEGGAKQAYWAAQDMGQFVLAPTAAVADPDPTPTPIADAPGTGDPSVPNIAMAALLVGAFLLLGGVLIYRRNRSRA